MSRIEIQVGDVIAEAELFDDKAPKTVAALLEALPIQDRTIQARWSGDAWRTEGNHELLPDGTPVENKADRLSAGDVIYYPAYAKGLIKIAVAYGKAQWLAPFMEPLEVAHIGKIDKNLDEYVAACQRIIFDGPLNVEIREIK